MPQTKVYFSDEQKAALDEESRRTGAPIAEIVRRAVDAWLRKEKKCQH